MGISETQAWIDHNPELAFVGIVVIGVILFLIERGIIARGICFCQK